MASSAFSGSSLNFLPPPPPSSSSSSSSSSPLPFQIKYPRSLSPRPVRIFASSSFHCHSPRPLPLVSSISGGSNGNYNGGGGGGGDGSGDEGGNTGDRNNEEVLKALADAGLSLDSLPEDLAAAIQAGKIPIAVVLRFLEMEKSPFPRWLLQFQGFKERLLADDLFLAKVAIECGLGVFTKTASEYEHRRENFFQELEIVFADVVASVIAGFTLVHLSAPTVSLGPPLGGAVPVGPITEFVYGCPNNAFQIALAGNSYSVLQRTAAMMLNGTKLVAVGTAASLVGPAIENTLINLGRAINKSSDLEVENKPMLATSLAQGIYMGLLGNLRYQGLAGVIEQRILEPLLHQEPLVLQPVCFAFRAGNAYLGSLWGPGAYAKGNAVSSNKVAEVKTDATGDANIGSPSVSSSGSVTEFVLERKKVSAQAQENIRFAFRRSTS